MQLLLSNPPGRRRKRRRTTTKRVSKKARRRRVNRRTVRRRRRTNAGQFTKRRFPAMARKTTQRRRRRRTPRRTFRRRSGLGRRVGGFIDTALLMGGAGVAAGVIGTGIVAQKLSPKIGQPFGNYTGPVMSLGIGLAGGYLLKKFNRGLATSFALGGVASAALQVYALYQTPQNKPAGMAGYGYDSLAGGVGEYQLPDGSTVIGADAGDGTVVDGLGNVYEVEA